MDLGFDIGVLSGGGRDELLAINAESTRLLKALTAGSGTDHALLTGGAALRRESLEATLINVTEREEHMVLWRRLSKGKATAINDEFTRQTSIGAWEGSAANGELDPIAEATGEYERKNNTVRFLMARRRVSVAAETQSQYGLVGAIAKETRNGTLELLRSANWLGYYGDNACSPVEYDGCFKILESLGFFTDLRGQTISSKAEEISAVAARVWSPDGGFGRLTDYFCSALVQTDLDHKLDSAHRVRIAGGKTDVTLGAPVLGIHTSFADIGKNNDPFIQETRPPWVGRGAKWSALAAASGVTPPTSIAGVAAADAASKFEAGHNGNYYWAVAGANKNGECATLRKTGAIAVAVGDKVTLTITEDPGETGTHYAIYRSRKNGTNADSDLRLVKRIPRNGGGTTTFVDFNLDIPGTSKMLLSENNQDSICWQRFLTLRRFPLFPTVTAETPWAQLLFLYLRIGMPERNHVIKNILPSTAPWRPFN